MKWIYGFVIFLIQLPMLARAPQNPDGAEMIMAALQGGVLHSPGYALQAWLNRLFILLPFGEPATRLALLSLLATALTSVVILYLFELLKISRISGFLAAGLYGFSPNIWYQSLQPEKYTFAVLLMSLVVLQMTLIIMTQKRSFFTSSIFLGSLCAFALNQHTTALLYAPFALCSLFYLNGSRWQNIFYALGGFLVVSAGLNASLLMLTFPSAWPDWGKIETLSDVFSILMMNDFKGLHPAQDPLQGDFRTYTVPLQLFFEDTWASFGFFTFLPLFGFFSFRKIPRPFQIALSSSLILHLIFLFFVRYPGSDLLAESYSERYSSSFALLFAICGGVALLPLSFWVDYKKKLAAAFVVIAWFGIFIHGYQTARANREMTVELFRKGLAANHFSDAYYFAGTGLELFAGFNTGSGTRFPIVTDYAWSPRSIALVEPRLTQNDLQGVRQSVETQRIVYARGGRIMTSDPATLRGAPRPIIQSGLFWILDPITPPEEIIRMTGAQIGRLCSVIQSYTKPRPKKGFRYARYLFGKFPEAFKNAAVYLNDQGDIQGAKLSQKVADALLMGNKPEDWIAPCGELENRYK